MKLYAQENGSLVVYFIGHPGVKQAELSHKRQHVKVRKTVDYKKAARLICKRKAYAVCALRSDYHFSIRLRWLSPLQKTYGVGR